MADIVKEIHNSKPDRFRSSIVQNNFKRLAVISRPTETDPIIAFPSVITSRIAEYIDNEGYRLMLGYDGWMEYVFNKYFKDRKEIYIPWNGFQNKFDFEDNVILPGLAAIEKMKEIANQVSPVFNTFDHETQLKIICNGCKLLGKDLDMPVDFVFSYYPTEYERYVVHTDLNDILHFTLAMAYHYNIPIFNLYDLQGAFQLKEFLDSRKRDIFDGNETIPEITGGRFTT